MGRGSPFLKVAAPGGGENERRSSSLHSPPEFTKLLDSGISPNPQIPEELRDSGIWGFGKIPESTDVANPGVLNCIRGFRDLGKSPNSMDSWIRELRW